MKAKYIFIVSFWILMIITIDQSLAQEAIPCDYQVSSYTAPTGTHIWTPSQNPFISNNNVITISDKLVIPTGSYVTIDSMRFEFGPEAFVEIQKGGKLILKNNSVFTAFRSCEGVKNWQGIYVEGTQGMQSDSLQRGVFKLYSHSVVEYAYTGVRNYGTDKSNSGGLIRTHKGIFRNNLIDVEMVNHKINDVEYSKFIQTTFETDEDIHAIYGKGAEPIHIYLKEHRYNLSIEGCVFINTYVSSNESDMSLYVNRGIGIYSISSTFRINRIGKNHSEFINLSRGVYALEGLISIANADFIDNFRGVYTYGMVAGPAIENCYFGVGNGYKGLIKHDANAYGIYLDQCTGYSIKYNDLQSLSYIRGNFFLQGRFGIVVNVSGTEENLINNNSLSDFYAGIQVQGVNGTGINGNITNIRGLVLKCNKFTNNLSNAADILLTKNAVIKHLQGDSNGNLSDAANNRFSNNQTWGWFRQASPYGYHYTIDYFYVNNPNSDLRPEKIYPGNIDDAAGLYRAPVPDTTVTDTYESLCEDGCQSASYVSCFEAILTEIEGEKALENRGISDLKSAINDPAVSDQALYSMIKNASPEVSSDVLETLIRSYPARPAWLIEKAVKKNSPMLEPVVYALISNEQLPDQLLEKTLKENTPLTSLEATALIKRQPAPWVLEKVLKKSAPLADQTVEVLLNQTPRVPAWVIKKVLKKNVPFSEQVQEMLLASDYPSWLIDYLMREHDKAVRQGKTLEYAEHRGFSEGALRDIKISGLNNWLHYYKNAVVRQMILSDSTGAGKEAALSFLKSHLCNDKEGCSAVEINLLMEDYTAALEELQVLSGISAENMEKYVATTEKYIALKTQLGGEEQLANMPVMKSEIETLASDTTYYGTGRGLAISISKEYVGYAYDEPLYYEELPEVPADNVTRSMQRTEEEEPTAVVRERQTAVLVPNPTSGNVQIAVEHLSETASSQQSTRYEVCVYSLDGKMLVKQRVFGKDAVMTLDLKPGIYIYTISGEDNRLITRDKIVVLER